jgi:hypothetical protein
MHMVVRPMIVSITSSLPLPFHSSLLLIALFAEPVGHLLIKQIDDVHSIHGPSNDLNLKSSRRQSLSKQLPHHQQFLSDSTTV